MSKQCKLTEEQYKNACFWGGKISLMIIGKEVEIEDLKVAGKNTAGTEKELAEIKTAYNILIEKVKEYDEAKRAGDSA